VVSIFVNPAQFAPTEDLSSYPRTLSSDIESLTTLQSLNGGVSAIFAPTVSEMYPSPNGQPFTQHVKDQVGAFVQVQGLQDKMEGSSRPTFFRGVTTICTKLFHIVEPHFAYFGQKDIQQAVILRRLVSDLLFSYPPSAEAVRVIKTTRDQNDGLALSSRNAYLTEQCRNHAAILYKSLCSAKEVWDNGMKESEAISGDLIRATLLAANQTAQEAVRAARKDDVSIEVLYISLNDPVTLQDLSRHPEATMNNRGAILSAAALIKQGREGQVTRLIDNFLLGFAM
jgi:pantoate--beta-alanine ligase